MSEPLDWNPIRALARRVLREGQPLSLTDDVRELLLRSAREVAISDADAARVLASDADARQLLEEISNRISKGSRRLTRTISAVVRCRDAGDVEGARQLLHDVLTVEVVPLYQDILNTYLESLDDEP
ncbi:DUSAM domain-containing protein [Myxococcus sp. SDU36]|uniref:DUSAM domain-containing protein n=1 Tax=Myxococcus sp. SDU36 TaxID=2831967 RepID=UPI002543D8FB|nr:DUSAM domain-containing protein [Myxococcus sp. SDU36]WIG93638.1 DUSAM domain-containing protein [Myxococcus sp. SDU36]